MLCYIQGFKTQFFVLNGSLFFFQAVTLKKYPAQLSLTTLICMMGALQGTVMTLVIEKGKKGIWSINWDTKLFATLYSVRKQID